MTLQQQPSLRQRAAAFFQRVLERASGTATTSVPRISDRSFARYTAYYEERVTTLARGLVNGTITADEWRAAMGVEVERLHTTAYVIGRGGVDQLSAADMQQIGAKVDEQLRYLDNWTNELRGGKGLDEAAITRRAKLYMNASNASVQGGTSARMGVPDLGQYPGDGQTRCRVNCRCKLRIKRLPGNGNYDVYWMLDPMHHEECEDCVRLSREWNPRRIRNGVILR